MSAAKHTPGPWSILPLEDGAKFLRVRGTQLGFRYKVCDVHAPFQHNKDEVLESQANARLIAAAPDLLAALQVAREFMSIASDWNVDEAEINGEMRSTYDLIADVDAVISKATGGL